MRGGAAFVHYDAAGRRHQYTAAENLLISEALLSGAQAVRLPPHKDNVFEVRFGANAVSARMPQPPSSGMIQVNLATNNTRIVRKLEEDPRFAHVGPDGTREPYDAETCAAIAAARDLGAASLRLPDVEDGGRTLRFEVRFGDNARSRRRPTPSETGVVQVNVDTAATRVVVEETTEVVDSSRVRMRARSYWGSYVPRDVVVDAATGAVAVVKPDARVAAKQWEPVRVVLETAPRVRERDRDRAFVIETEKRAHVLVAANAEIKHSWMRRREAALDDGDAARAAEAAVAARVSEAERHAAELIERRASESPDVARVTNDTNREQQQQQQQRRCRACLDDCRGLGLTCDRGHFCCNECAAAAVVAAVGDDDLSGRAKRGGRVHCPLYPGECDAPPLDDCQVSRLAPPDVFARYQKCREDELEEARVAKQARNEANRQIQLAIDRIPRQGVKTFQRCDVDDCNPLPAT